jgi:hypothetical protein
MPKSNLKPISHLISHKSRKIPLSSEKKRKEKKVLLPSPQALIFSIHHRSPQSLSLSFIKPKSFPKRARLNRIKLLSSCQTMFYLSIMLSQIDFALNETSNGMPRYFISKETPCNQGYQLSLPHLPRCRWGLVLIWLGSVNFQYTASKT